MKKQRAIKAKNEIYIHTLAFFALCMVVLLFVFLLIGNIGEFTRFFNLEKTTSSELLADEYYLQDDSGRVDFANSIKPANVYGTKAPHVCIYSTKDDYIMITTQLFITKQPYTEVDSLFEVSADEQLLIIQTDSLSIEEVEIIQKLSDSGVALLFLGLPDAESLSNYSLKYMLGINTFTEETSWNGIRTSSDLLTGTLVDRPNYEITGMEVVLTKNNKVYACALPEGYEGKSNDELPPVIWRHIITETDSRVYVFNGDYAKTEMGYGIVPVVISEINENYIYPVINAYSIIVTGYPYAQNESRESWTRLYSRNKMQIQQDMFSGQLKKYAKLYKSRISCFSPDYETFLTTDDINLRYYYNEIISSRGILADENNGNLKISQESDNVTFEDWNCYFEFLDEKDCKIHFPICFDSVIGDSRVDDYAIGGFASTMGFFSVKIDYGKYLEYDGTDDVWSIYSSEQEVMIGVKEREYGWMENTTATEAVGRIIKLLKMEPQIEYCTDSINISVPDLDGDAWFILRSDKDNLKIDNGTIEETGRGCYFVTMTDKNATITWKE